MQRRSWVGWRQPCSYFAVGQGCPGRKPPQIKVTCLCAGLTIWGLWVTFLETHREWLTGLLLLGKAAQVLATADRQDQLRDLRGSGGSEMKTRGSSFRAS